MKGKTPGLTIFRAESVEFFLFIEQKVENRKKGRFKKKWKSIFNHNLFFNVLFIPHGNKPNNIPSSHGIVVWCNNVL